MSIVIQADHLGKKYVLRHESRDRYRTLRDLLANRAKSIFTLPFLHRNKFEWAASKIKKREDFWALHDISFSVREGEKIGIIGKNGAGKTTLLKILSQITEPTTGSVCLRGRVSSLLEVGTGFHPELTGRENIFLNGAILGMKREEIKRKFAEIVAFAEMEKFLDTPVKRYSSGMYVRLAFAIAAHLEPEILLIDEILAVGDLAFQKKCVGKMEEVNASGGRTILFVSHNMSLVTAFCQKALLLNAGEIQMSGNVRDVVNQYLLTISSSPKTDLANLKHQGHCEYATLLSLSLYDKNFVPGNTFSMGQMMIADIELCCRNRMKDAEVGLKISSLTGLAVHYFSSSWEGEKRDLEPGHYRYRVTIPKVFLFPGKYLLGLWILRDGFWSDDSIQDVTTIEILGNDVTGNFEKFQIKNTFDRYAVSGGEVYAPSKWEIFKEP